MEKPLIEMKCEVCRVGAPLLSDEEIGGLLPQVPDWRVIEQDGMKRLERVFTHKDFVNAIKFTNKIGDIAEEHGHHPALLTEWGKVTVQWWTHKIKGLHRNDFIMAAKSDQVYKDF